MSEQRQILYCDVLTVIQLQLWSTKTGEQIVCFYHAEMPVFTLDCKYLLYIDAGQTVITYCLQRMAPIRYMSCRAEHLMALPVRHRLVLVTSVAADGYVYFVFLLVISLPVATGVALQQYLQATSKCLLNIPHCCGPVLLPTVGPLAWNLLPG